MKEKNILIIGNGFDIALDRKTKYEDFIKFASQIVGNPEENIEDFSFSQIFGFAESEHTTYETHFETSKNCIAEILCEEIYNRYKEYFIELEVNDLKFLQNYKEMFYQDFMLEGKKNTLKEYFITLDNNIECAGETNKFYKFIDKFFESKIENYRSYKLQTDILLQVIKESTFYKSKANSNINVQADIERFHDFFDLFSKNIIIEYILYNRTIIDNWNNLENQISLLADSITVIKENLNKINPNYFYSNIPNPKLYGEEENIRRIFATYENSNHINFVLNKIVSQSFNNNKAIYSIINQFNNNLKLSLQSLTYLLELYLSYLNRIEDLTEIQKNSNVDLLKFFGNIDNILTFNYTNTAELKFPIPEGQIHYIHGKENFINSSVEETNLVFGIEDNNENINKDIIEYQKTFQRIIKKTGYIYKSFLEQKNLKNIDLCRVIFFGHSLDILDKEILLDFFKVDLQNFSRFEFFVLYYGKEDLKNKVINLSLILGKDKLVNLSSENYIHFIDTSNFQKAEIEIKEEITRNNRMFQLKEISKRQNYQNYRSIVK